MTDVSGQTFSFDAGFGVEGATNMVEILLFDKCRMEGVGQVPMGSFFPFSTVDRIDATMISGGPTLLGPATQLPVPLHKALLKTLTFVQLTKHSMQPHLLFAFKLACAPMGTCLTGKKSRSCSTLT